MKRWLRGFATQRLPVREAYARWAPGYAAEAHNPLMRLEQAAMLDWLPSAAGARALDLACGSGRYLRALAERGAEVIGLDLSPEMLGRAAGLGRPLARGDMVRLPFAAAAFDLVVCGLAVGHAPALGPVLAEAARVLRPGGALLYSDFHPLAALSGLERTFRAADGRQYAVEHHLHLYEDHHAACLAAGLSIAAVREPRLDVKHPWQGRPAVLIILARKP
jgi:SAM-dependent methyltransferase